MNVQELKEVVLFLKEQGVCSFEIADVKVSFDPRSFPSQVKFDNVAALKETVSSIMSHQDKLRQAEEDLLFASAT
jgi:hypothetical protein